MQKYIDEFVEQFKDHVGLNDKAHQMEHFMDVFNEAVMINDKFNWNYPKEALLAVALFHDLFAWSRENHHELSQKFVETSNNPLLLKLIKGSSTAVKGSHSGFYDEDVARHHIALSCGQHRASYKGEYSSSLSEIMATADRGKPCETETVRRAYLYARDKNKEGSREEWVTATAVHMREKFSTSGYARYPEMYKQVYGEELAKLRKYFDNVTIEGVYELTKDL